MDINVNYKTKKAQSKHLIKTNIITGFLGVGKTTAIQQLIASKPKHERWTILVNEFGEIGIDHHFYRQRNTNDSSLFIKQVVGGCMCCIQAPLTKFALNEIIRQQKPDRLLIEPSGLGHLDEILETIMSSDYESWLDCRNTVNIVDPRHFSDQRYTGHEIFQRQCQLSDVIVANKYDIQNASDINAMRTYLAEHGLQDKPVFFVEQGELKPEWLEPAARLLSQEMSSEQEEHHEHNHGQDWHTVGFRYPGHLMFDRTRLLDWCKQLGVMRLKLIVNCEKTGLIVNIVGNDCDIVKMEHGVVNSHIEVIDDKPIVKKQIKDQLDNIII